MGWREKGSELSEMHTAYWCVQRRVWRWEFECLAHCFTGVFLPSRAVCKVERTLLYQEVWRLSGTIRVNGRNCKDCPETDGKQSLNGIGNRCEA